MIVATYYYYEKVRRMISTALVSYLLRLRYCHDRYKTHEMCSKAVDDFLPVLNFVSDWFRGCFYHDLLKYTAVYVTFEGQN